MRVPLAGYDGCDMSAALLLRLREGVGSQWHGWYMPVGRLAFLVAFGYREYRVLIILTMLLDTAAT
jgi:hypothetical protein